MIDKVFNKTISKQFEFDEEVASVFDDMLERSVPFYKQMQKLSISFANNFLKENVSLLTGTGEKVLDASNAIGVNSTQRMVMSWNDFVNQYQGQCFNYSVNRYYHDGVLVEDYFTGNNIEQVNLIQYLEDNQADYIDAHKKLYKVQNQLGL